MFIAQLAQSKGIDERRSKTLVTAMGIVNIVARVLCGYERRADRRQQQQQQKFVVCRWIADRPSVDALVVSNVAVIAGGVATIVLPCSYAKRPSQRKLGSLAFQILASLQLLLYFVYHLHRVSPVSLPSAL